jgi:signal peptidase I
MAQIVPLQWQDDVAIQAAIGHKGIGMAVVGSKSKGKLRREAKARLKDARKLLGRARRRIGRETREALTAAIKSVVLARKSRDPDKLETTLDELGLLVEQHLAPYRKSAFREYSESIGLAVLFALMLRAFVVEAFQIPSASMVPTLLIGDHLFVNKFVYGVRIPFTRFDLIDFGDPERGDVVVFIYPVEEVRTQDAMRGVMSAIERFERLDGSVFPESLDTVGYAGAVDDWGTEFRYERAEGWGYHLASAGPDLAFGTSDDLTNQNTAIRPGDRPCVSPESLEDAKDYIKRVIGLPGDRVRVDNNIVYVNDEPIPQEIRTRDSTTPRDDWGRRYIQAVETINGADYIVQFSGSLPDFDEITVREDYIFVMGDNRGNSSDSRCWGQVPIENVKGEALFIFWSGGGEGSFLNNRWERMFGGVE